MLKDSCTDGRKCSYTCNFGFTRTLRDKEPPVCVETKNISVQCRELPANAIWTGGDIIEQTQL